MPDQAIRDALFATLESQRDDPITLAALADWFEEHDDAGAAACLRWVARNGRRPGFNSCQVNYGRYFWELQGPEPILDDPRAQLPAGLWIALEGYDEARPVNSFKSFASVRLAYFALLLAWERCRDHFP